MGPEPNLDTPRCSVRQMLAVVRRLETGADDVELTPDEIAGLTENARRVAKKHWELKSSGRSEQSVQNQLDRPRWRFLDQTSEAFEMLKQVADDAGLTGKHFPDETDS